MTPFERRHAPTASPITPPGEENHRRLRARLYLGAIAIGAPIMLVLWAVNLRVPTPDPFTHHAYPPMLALYVWAAYWLIARRPVATAERAVFVGEGLFLLGQLLALLLTPGTTVDLSSSAYWTLTALAIIGFLIFDARQGALIMLALYLLSVVMPWLVLTGTGTLDARWVGLLRVQLTCGAILMLLSGLAWYRERYTRELLHRQAFEQLAFTDALTGVANRRALYGVLERELANAEGEPLSVVLFDLDHFKRLNDTAGHNAGDAALVETARRVSGTLRASDAFGRWGGEEFLVLLPGTPEPEALGVAERLRRRLADEAVSGVGRVTASFGVATVQAGDTPERLVGRADAALYRAKALGRNRVASAEVNAVSGAPASLGA